MSDDAVTKNGENSDGDALALDLIDALDSWEQGLDRVAVAEASPLGSEPPDEREDDASELSLESLEPIDDAEAFGHAARRPPPPPPAAPQRPQLAPPEASARAEDAWDELAEDAPPAVVATTPPPSPSKSVPALPVSVDDRSGSTVIEPTPDELVEAILEEERPSTPRVASRAPDREHGPDHVETLRPFMSAARPEPLRPTPLVAPSDVALHEQELRPTPLVAPGDAPMLEILFDSSELTTDSEFDDPTDVSERPGFREKRERLTRLEALAQRSTGEVAAELLISAGELAEELGELATAETLYERALDHAKKHAPALRALARLSFRASDFSRHAQLIERLSEQAGPTSEHARALSNLALVRWAIQKDETSALRAATEAARLAPTQLGYGMLLARIEAATYPTHLDATLIGLAERTQDKALAAMWWVAAGRAAEARGDHAAARPLYERATHTDPFAFDAQLSLSRVQHVLGEAGEAARSLLRTLESFDIGPVAEAVRRRAAHMLGSVGVHSEAVALLEHASDDVSLRTAMQVALASDDAALKAKAAEGWALGSDGVERALALLTQAELLVAQGEFTQAETALELAALADAQQGLVAIAREALARRAGKPARLAEIVATTEDGRGALAAAAMLASSPAQAADEFTWLREAAESGDAGLLPEVLAIDTGAELARLGEVESLLSSVAGRGPVESRIRTLLALAEILVQRGQQEAAREALQRAAELAPGYAPAERAYARTLGESEQIAAAYEREAGTQQGARAAFMRLRAGYAREAGSSARLEAFARAWQACPSYAPAAWALHFEARRQGDLPRLAALHAGEAERATDVSSRVAHLVRAALIPAGDDSDGAAEQLTRALALTPDDPILAELVIRVGDAAQGHVRAAALVRLSQRAEEPFRSPLLIAAAGALEDERRFEEAAERYREVLRTSPHDPVAEVALARVTAASSSPAERVAAARNAVDEATTERERARALEQLLLCESEPARVLETAHALLALLPAHALGLRSLERDAMTRDDRAALRAVEERLIHGSRGGHDRAARLRLYHLLHLLDTNHEGAQDASHEDSDRKLLECAADASQSLWLARQLMSAAVAAGRRDLVVRAVDLLVERSNDGVELASLAVQRGWLLLGQAGATAALESQLREALGGYPEHPTALEFSAEARREAGDYQAAAELFEQAAAGALAKERAAHLWARAAHLWDEQVAQPERAKAAFMRAAEKELDHPRVQERLIALLTEQKDLDGLIALTRARVAESTASGELTELRRRLAELYAQRGDRESAQRCLREALADAPDDLAVWRDLAREADRADEPVARAEALGSVIRLSRDPLELRDALLALADLHETQLVDLGRAEAAYQRVLKLGPRNPIALERLALLYKRQSKHELATDALAQLIRSLPEGGNKHELTLQLAAWKRDQGDRRAAEELLESLRRNAPTDRVLLRRITELLHQASDQPALALHLRRALHDIRQALVTRLGDTDLWCALIDTLLEKGERDAAGMCAETALALGMTAATITDHVRPRPEGLGIASAGLSELLDDLVYPEGTPPALRIVFRHAASALNHVAPLELRELGAERLEKRHPLRDLVAEQARWIGARDVELYTTTALPFAFVPIQDTPAQLLVGSSLLESLSADEQRFLVARALKLARAQMSITCRLPPAEMELWLHALVRNQIPGHAPAFIESGTLEEAARRIGKQLKRAAQHELAPHLFELNYRGAPRFDAHSVYGSASIAASRAALLAVGQVGPALSALLKLSGARPDGFVTSPANVAQVDEARELVAFVIGDGYVEARDRAGKEGR